MKTILNDRLNQFGKLLRVIAIVRVDEHHDVGCLNACLNLRQPAQTSPAVPRPWLVRDNCATSYGYLSCGIGGTVVNNVDVSDSG